VIRPEAIRRIPLGHFTVPEDVDDHRVGQKIVVVAYLVEHPAGRLLFDTGIGEGHAEADARYHPVRRSLDRALEAASTRVDDVALIVNCHLHFDHAGGNHRFGGRPIFAQRIEFDAAHEPDYTLPEAVADFPGAAFELIDGDAEPLPGVHILPTPGHVPGHQSLVVDTTAGRVVIAGQALNEASAYAHRQYAWTLREGGAAEPDPEIPDWIGALQAYDPWRVVFAHDLAIWEADRASPSQRA
jgi:glyoxylase-like metal-dependent hydrolase (beta-lactamase superfamily II)